MLVVDAKILHSHPLYSAAEGHCLRSVSETHRTVTMDDRPDSFPVNLVAHPASVDHVPERDP